MAKQPNLCLISKINGLLILFREKLSTDKYNQLVNSYKSLNNEGKGKTLGNKGMDRLKHNLNKINDNK